MRPANTAIARVIALPMLLLSISGAGCASSKGDGVPSTTGGDGGAARQDIDAGPLGAPDQWWNTHDGAMPPPDAGAIEDPPEVDAGMASIPVPTGPGSSCTGPTRLTLVDGRATITDSTVGETHDHNGPGACTHCYSRIDKVYAVDVPAMTRVRANYTSTGIVDCISVQRDCPEMLVGGFTCGDPDTTLTNPRDGKDFMEAGTAYIFVWADGEKDIELTVETETIPAP